MRCIFHTVKIDNDILMCGLLLLLQLHNSNAAACVEHVSIQATGQYVYSNISIPAGVYLPKISPVAVLLGAQIRFCIICFSVLVVIFVISFILNNLTKMFSLTKYV